MIKNIYLKNFLTGSVFSLLSSINKHTVKDPRNVLLYSDLGFRDNLKALYDYMISHHYNRKYRIICAVSDWEDYVDVHLPNVTFVNPVSGVRTYLRSGHVFYCFGKLPITPSKDQTVCQMWHGTSFKGFAENQVRTTNSRRQFYTQVFASSDYFRPIVEKKFGCTPDRIRICGHPRTDIMYQDKPVYKELQQYRKVVIWLPTFRKSSSVGMSDGNGDEIVPVLNASEFAKMDQWLKSHTMKLIIKLHPVQDISGLKASDFQNLELLTNEAFTQHNWNLYAMLRQSDALITDYSSVFYDYLLLNRPIGFTEDDVEQYRDSRGFAVDPELFRPGMRIRTTDDLYKFLESVSDGHDNYRKERENINNLSNRYQDGHNARRALELNGISI